MIGQTEHVEESGTAASLHAAAESLPAIAERVRRADERLVAYVRERPLVALGAALGMGYVMGRVFSRIGR
jgi:ElaB/YqjD/DUF883 family membrane-anchored ribosome-binding protein